MPIFGDFQGAEICADFYAPPVMCDESSSSRHVIVCVSTKQLIWLNGNFFFKIVVEQNPVSKRVSEAIHEPWFKELVTKSQLLVIIASLILRGPPTVLFREKARWNVGYAIPKVSMGTLGGEKLPKKVHSIQSLSI